MVRTKIKPENPDANLKSYSRTYKDFSWADAAKELPGYDPAQTNIVEFAVDRWARDENMKTQAAVIFEKGGHVEHVSYEDLRERSCKWANLLASKGFGAGTVRLCSRLVSKPMWQWWHAHGSESIFCNVYPSSSSTNLMDTQQRETARQYSLTPTWWRGFPMTRP